MIKITVQTNQRSEFYNITAWVQAALAKIPQAATASSAVVFIPHTTAGITINENADPDVCIDIITSLDQLVPWNAGWRHGEGNSAAHIKASLMGSSVTIPLIDGKLALGAWQGIYFCEFDGPRRRTAWISA